jgi:hypothetical protein
MLDYELDVFTLPKSAKELSLEFLDGRKTQDLTFSKHQTINHVHTLRIQSND